MPYDKSFSIFFKICLTKGIHLNLRNANRSEACGGKAHCTKQKLRESDSTSDANRIEEQEEQSGAEAQHHATRGCERKTRSFCEIEKSSMSNLIEVMADEWWEKLSERERGLSQDRC